MRARASVLLAVGLAAIVGDLTGSAPLHALGVAWNSSPAPLVFASRGGLEGFSSTFHVEGTDGRVTLDPAIYARMRGPYNRRNVYGAALAGGPWLAEHPHLGRLHASVAARALCGERSLLDELEVEVGRPLRVIVEPRPGTVTDLPLVLEAPCR